MAIFQSSARCYDLIYREKDYAAESRYVDALIQEQRPGARRLLELGCGTGNHLAELLARGYQIHGVDRSDEMLQRARARYQSGPDAPRFTCADLRALELDERFDAITALFHVMSYQTSDADLAAAFRVARRHLLPGGIFLFDCWHAPAVESTPPEVRRREWGDEPTRVVRTATPTLHRERRVVDVHYRIEMTDRRTGEQDSFEETHSMRYFHAEEISRALSVAGFSLREQFAWLTRAAPTANDWGVCYVAAADAG